MLYRNVKLIKIDRNSITPTVDIVVVPVLDRHIESMRKDCENYRVQPVVDASIVSILDRRTDPYIGNDNLNLCFSESDIEDECNRNNNTKSKEMTSSYSDSHHTIHPNLSLYLDIMLKQCLQ